MICSRWHGSLFEDYVTTYKCDRYNRMYSIDAYKRNHNIKNKDASSGGVRALK